MTSSPRRPTAPQGTPPAPGPVTLGGTIGSLAIAVGLGVIGAYMLDLHAHTCEKCGRRWRHFGAFNLGDEDSHTCSRCGEVQWWKCGAPHVMRGSQFVERMGGVPAAPPQLSVPVAAAAPTIPAAFPSAFAGAPSPLGSGPTAPVLALPSPSSVLATVHSRRSR